MTATQDKYVWYVSYGSNINRERFLAYILGGRRPGGTRDQSGCTDRTPPVKDIAVEIPNSLYFGGEALFYSCGAFVIAIPKQNDAFHFVTNG